MKRIAIIGGGIAGLSAAFYLEQAKRRGAAIEHQLFERSSRLGGILHTERIGEFVVEAGADSFLTEKPEARELCRELGLEDELIGSNDAARRIYIVLKGKMVPLPSGLNFIVPVTPGAMHSEIFSATAQQQIEREMELAPRESSADESVATFVERHFGRELLERVAGPMLAGIYGGDVARLSARAVLPRFVEMERRHGSLIRALQASKGSGSQEKSAGAIFTSLKHGMQQLVDAIVKQFDPACIHMNTRIERLSQTNGGWSFTGQKVEHFDGLVLAVPAWAASELLQEVSPELAHALSKVTYTSSMAVALGFASTALRGHPDIRNTTLPPGFGFLVPGSEGRRLLACTFVHNKFLYRVPEDGYLVRLFFGGAHHEAALTLTDDEAVSLARRELESITGLNVPPSFCRVWRWPQAMAQYDVGHLELVEQIESLRSKIPELALAGNAYHGIGIPDCVRSGRQAAQQFL